MDQDEVDLALAQLGADGDRIAAALVDLENHPGLGFLEDAQLSGGTLRRWTETKATISVLWERYESYRRVLDSARLIRAKRSRPSAADLAELTVLLRGPAVELAGEEVPLDRRSLTGPASIVRRLRLTELVDSMTSGYAEVTAVVVAADAVWSAVANRLDQLQRQVVEAQTEAGALGLGETRHPLTDTLTRIADELTTVRELAFADPLALYVGGAPDVSRLTRVAEELTGVRAGLAELADLRDRFAERIDRLRDSITELAAAEYAAGEARTTVLDKIAVSALPAPPDAAVELSRRLDELAGARAKRNWPALAAQFDGLVRAVGAALVRARADQDTAAALLGRRAELRGRLDAYRVKAARLRYAEDPVITARYQEAHDLLWTAPCDLQAATRALVRYQQAIADRGMT